MNSIFKMTFREMFRQPSTWLILLASVLLMEILPSFGQFSFGKSKLVVLDILQGSIMLSVLLFSIHSSYQLLGRELNRRVALTLLTKPISRAEVLIAKVSALCFCLFLFSFILGLQTARQGLIAEWDSPLWQAFAFSWFSILIQGFSLLSLSVFFLLLFNPLAGIFGTLAVYLLSYILPLSLVYLLFPLIPAYRLFEMQQILYTGVSIEANYVIMVVIYGLTITGFFLYSSILLLNRKEF